MAAGAAWLLFRHDPSILPGSIAGAFDSAEAVLETADANDMELKRLIDEIDEKTVSEEKIKAIAKVASASSRLIARAVQLDPLRESDVTKLVADDEDGRLEGPLNEELIDSLREHILALPQQHRGSLISIASTGFGSAEFVREYLQFGHLQLGECDSEVEKIDREHIELLRELNRLGADVFLKLPREAPAEPLTGEQANAKLGEIYQPIHDDVASLTDQMYELAERRYRLPKERAGVKRQFDDVQYYTDQARARVFGTSLALVQHGAKIVGPLGEFAKASKDYESAVFGIMPSRVADAKQEQDAIQP